eukprot:CAMPEP_0197438466 /NCGR_PEP_ID=MMETSP1175-20131217/5463_1 /TAXON_ID=1003142 /ORGANISM="Triceratium dubium, Strain CCMP147" /LENGTH=457 /DNA_ID=CAMNT_0042968211 /DNA_START=93 /DNA_END=1466 /DNA_ORIENTATION=-
MGNTLVCIASACRKPRRQARILIMGLDAAGKTTVLYRLSHGKVVTTIPTIGFNVETVQLSGTEITAWDVGGRDKIRPLWRHYYKNCDALVFVVDSNDVDRMDHAKHELQITRNEVELKGLPVLLLCNKQDLPKALSPDEISSLFGIGHDDSNNIFVAGCSATKGEGLHEGFAWLENALEANAQDEGTNGTAINGDLDDNADKSQILVKAKNNIDFNESTAEGGNMTLARFLPIKNGSECPFAKSSKLWGGVSEKHQGISIEDQALANVPALSEFVRRSNSGERLDGFCIELDDPSAREGSPEDLGECVRRLLSELSKHDPAGDAVMKKVPFVGSRGWRFRFGRADCFVTSFAPCYPNSSSRYAFGTGRAFVLLQPEASFARHNLPIDTATTQWENPRTVRDKARAAFKAAGRPYHIPETTHYPPAEHIVKPIVDDGTSVIRWWQGGTRVSAEEISAY